MTPSLKRFLAFVIVLLAIVHEGTFSQCWLLQKNVTDNFVGVSFPSPTTGTVIGIAGTILRTTDGGVSWISQSIPVGPRFLEGVSFIDTNRGLVVGFDINRNNGLVLGTTNGGVTWVRSASPTSNELHAVVMIDSNIAVAVGEQGTILRTTDAGMTWTSQSSGTMLPLYAVSFADENHGVIVGEQGVILQTTNGGVDWVNRSTTSTSTLKGIVLKDLLHGTAVGYDGVILRTTNGGASWAFQQNNIGYQFFGVSFADTAIGTVVGENENGVGIFYQTSDGGVSWNAIVYHGSLLNAVTRLDSVNSVAVSGSGSILRSAPCETYPPLNPITPLNGYQHQALGLTSSYESSLQLVWSPPFVDIRLARLQLSLDANFTGVLFDTTLATAPNVIANSFVAKQLLPGTSYYWRVMIGLYDGTMTDWSPVWNFTTAKGIIQGSVFEDDNRDSIFNITEQGLANWTVDLTGAGHETILTDSNGRYMFSGLDSGTYTVNEHLLQVWKNTLPGNSSYQIVLGLNDSVPDKNFGNYFPWSSISGKVFYDMNENGVQDAGEPGLSRWIVRLKNFSGDSTWTDSNGVYAFPHLVTGSYIVTLQAQPSWEQIPFGSDGYYLSLSSYDQHFPNENFSVHKIPRRVRLIMTVHDNTSFDVRDIWWGVRPGASFGIWGADTGATNFDYAEGEFDLPPQLEGGFDARFDNPRPRDIRFGFGSWTDMRDMVSPTQVDTYRVSFQPGIQSGGDYPMTLRWSKKDMVLAYDGSVILTDTVGTNVDMKTFDSMVVTNANISSLLLIAQHPVLPVSDVKNSSIHVPVEYSLGQNYPNPFNPLTVIGYQLPVKSNVVLKIYNVLGQEVTTLVDETEEAGYKSVQWNADGGVASGIYFYRISAVDFQNQFVFRDVKKMLLIK